MFVRTRPLYYSEHEATIEWFLFCFTAHCACALSKYIHVSKYIHAGQSVLTSARTHSFVSSRLRCLLFSQPKAFLQDQTFSKNFLNCTQQLCSQMWGQSNEPYILRTNTTKGWGWNFYNYLQYNTTGLGTHSLFKHNYFNWNNKVAVYTHFLFFHQHREMPYAWPAA